MWATLRQIAAVVVLLGPALSLADSPQSVAQAEQRTRTVGLFASVGYLGSPGASGAATDLGVRWVLNRHVALSADYGYGMVGAAGTVQDPSHNVEDRWWIMPAVAWIIPTRRVGFDLGAGLGLATASGYPSWASFRASPFGPTWAFQLAPAARLHAMASLPIGPGLELFARVDAGSLLLGGNSVGIRSGNPTPGAMDTTWLGLSMGARYGLF
jgi:hypothetical protein